MNSVNARILAATFLTVALFAVPRAGAVAQSGVPSFLEVGKDYSLLMAWSAGNEDMWDIKVVEIGTDGWLKAHDVDDEDDLFWINTDAVLVIFDLQEQAAREAAEQAEYEAWVTLQESMLAAIAPFVLRRLMGAQEAHHADHGTYSTELRVDDPRSGDALVVHIMAADSTGWNAIVASRITGLSQCGVSIGTGPATNSLIPEGEVVCSDR